MRVLFSLVPDYLRTSNPYKASMDIGLGYLASSLRSNDFPEVDLFLDQHSGIDFFLDKVDLFQPDLIGFKVFSQDISNVNRVIKILKTSKKYKHIIIVIGGPSPSGNVKNIFSTVPLIDFAFYAEAEIGFPLLCKHLAVGYPSLPEIPNLIYKEKDGIAKINASKVVDDLDSLPFPAWDIIKPETFPNTPPLTFSKKHPIAYMITSRGCPFRCKFCASFLISGRKVRNRSPENILAEIKYLIENHGIKEIQFYDTNIFHHRDKIKELCRLMIREKIDIVWQAPGVQLHSIDDELMKLVKESGCYQFAVGIESGNDRVLKYIRKGITKSQIEEKIQLIHKYKINITGFIMIGFPTETAEEMNETYEFAKKLPLIHAAISIFSCLPGSPFYHEFIQQGIFDKLDENTLNYIDSKNNASEVDDSTLKHLHKKYNLLFHLRPKQLFYFIKNINNLDKAKYLFYAIYRVLIKARPS